MKKISIRIVMTAICLILCVQPVMGAQLVIPGGQIIGLELHNHTVSVAAFDQVLGKGAQDCGLQIGDQITAVNGKAVHSAEDIRNALTKTDGEALLSVRRNGKNKQLRIKPEITENGPRLGVYLKQGITGVGTVTWYEPDSGTFGALGHGVNDGSGSLVTMEQGKVYNATVLTVKAGKSGTPGQLMSAMAGTDEIGSLSKNTAQGVFGKANLSCTEQMLPVGSREDVHTGNAIIRSTVAGNQVQEYSVEIMKVYPNSGPSGRNMIVKVTDPELLAATGGIVQGMSGSPIIQDGKLVGAVTHVLVNDPTTGYGIFIENMLDAAA